MQPISHRAILLLGPTGSGKTPFGNLCEQRGLWGGRCLHFDFGANLRKIGAHCSAPFLTPQDIEVILDSLRTGSLLKDEHFHIARSILIHFAAKNGMGPDSLLILNGLPRHAGQARAMDGLVDVRMVVHLSCSPGVAHKRIRLNSGGDRSGRTDDSLEEIERKLNLFNERTLPLLEFYRSRGARIERFEIAADTSPEEIHGWANTIMERQAQTRRPAP